MTPISEHPGISYHWIKHLPTGELMPWCWTDNDFGVGWLPIGWAAGQFLDPVDVSSDWEYVCYISMPVGG